MTRVGVMSDTHSRLPQQIYSFFKDVDVIIHAGDIGNVQVIKQLRAFKPLVAVYGNCDDRYLDEQVKGLLSFKIEDVNILLTHIGGYPKHYDSRVKLYLKSEKPDLFICGHSHILRVMYDEDYKFLLVNPGACGLQGFHQVCTLVRFEIEGSQIQNLDILDFDKYPSH